MPFVSLFDHDVLQLVSGLLTIAAIEADCGYTYQMSVEDYIWTRTFWM